MDQVEKSLWQADYNHLQESNILAFANFVSTRHSCNLRSWKKLHRWSISETTLFWEAISDFLEIKWRNKPEKTYEADPNNAMLSAKWFLGGKLNFAENLLNQAPEEDAIISLREGSLPLRYSKKTLYNDVRLLAKALKRSGISKGDVVAAAITNSYESVIIFLATASLGAIFSSCSPDFGASGIIDRFGQINPKILFFGCEIVYFGCGILYFGYEISNFIF